MRPTTALQRIEMLRIEVRPKSNHLTAFGNAIGSFPEMHSRGVGAARRPQLPRVKEKSAMNYRTTARFSTKDALQEDLKSISEFSNCSESQIE